MNVSHLQAPDPNWDKLNSGCQNDKKPCGRILMFEENKSCISYCRKKRRRIMQECGLPLTNFAVCSVAHSL